MRKLLLLLTFLTFILQVKSQDSEIEIYLMQTNSIVKGKLLECSVDSICIMVDSLTNIAFAKSELEGRELPVSKELSKFRNKLIRKESIKIGNSFPGIYQLRNGELTKGKIMLTLSAIGLIGVLTSGVVFVAVINAAPGLYGVFAALAKSGIVFVTSMPFVGISSGWSAGDRYKSIERMVNNRYYFKVK
jgi:hypothetical protein